MEKKRFNKKLRSVYMGFLGIFLVAAVVLNVVYAYFYSYSAAKRDLEDRTRTLDQTVYYFDQYMENLKSVVDVLSISSEVQKLLTHSVNKNYMDYLSCSTLLNEYTMQLPNIYRIDYYVQDTAALITSNEGVFYDVNEKEYYTPYLDSEESWFWDTEYKGKEPRIVQSVRGEAYVTLIKPVRSIYNSKTLGVLCFSLKAEEFENMLPKMEPGEESMYLNYKDTRFLGEKLERNGVRAITSVSEYSGIEFQYYYIMSNVSFMNAQFGLTILAIALLFIAVFLAVVRISEKRMFGPAGILLDGFREVERGNFDIRLDQDRNDLFADLFGGFNHMTMIIERMIHELSDERTKRNEFKYRLLQMQIKPHFLYNLFNNMIWMVEQKDYERLEILIQSTAGYYKTALNFGNSNIMLIDNQKQLEYYVEIQKIRFGDTFYFQVDFPEEVWLYQIPNLLLQPLVENATVHGLKNVSHDCHIYVTAEKTEESLILQVKDDGCGISAQELKDIRNALENFEEDGKKYVALVNITARIHNRYKGNASFTLESEQGHGTTATIILPLKEVDSCIE